MIIIDVFKKNYIVQALVITLSAAALWLKSFLYAGSVTSAVEPYSLLFHHISSFSATHPLLSVIIAFVLIFAEGAYLNHILTSNGLVHTTTLFPMFVYISLMSVSPENHTLTPLIFTNAFLLAALHNLLLCYEQEHSFEKVFNASFCIALAFLFYFPSMYLVLFVIITFVVYRLYYWREWVVLLLGFVAPFFSLFAYYYIVDDLDLIWQRLTNEFMRVSMVVDMSNSVQIVISAFIAVTGIVALFAILGNLSKNVIIYRKKTTIIMFLLLTGALFSLYDVFIPVNQQNYAIPMTFMLVTFFVSLRKHKKVCNVVFLLFVVATLAGAYL